MTTRIVTILFVLATLLGAACGVEEQAASAAVIGSENSEQSCVGIVALSSEPGRSQMAVRNISQDRLVVVSYGGVHIIDNLELASGGSHPFGLPDVQAEQVEVAAWRVNGLDQVEPNRVCRSFVPVLAAVN